MSRSSFVTFGKTIMDHPIPNEQQFVASTAAEIPEVQVQFKWKVENLKRFVEFASGIIPTPSVEKYLTAAKLPFWKCAEANQKRKFLFCVKYFNWNPVEKGLYVTLELETSKVHDRLPDLSDWFIDYSVGIQRNEDEGFTVINTELDLSLKNLTSNSGSEQRPITEMGQWRTRLYDAREDLNNFVGVDNSVTLLLKVRAYQKSDGKVAVADATPVKDATTAMKLFAKGQEKFLEKVGSLLGDEETSDVTISVVNDEGKEIRKFHCHRIILSARSDVFRAMFGNKNFMESQTKEVKISEVSVEVVDQFLMFLYTGRLKDKRREGSDEPVWVEMLPQLVYISQKYGIKELVEFCDGNLYRAVTKTNVAEIVQVAKRHGLGKALAKLRESKYKDMLFESVPE